MISIISFQFFQNALIAGLLASVTCGIIGTYVVVKKMVALSGGISHAAFGGIGLGYYAGIDPILGAIVFSLASALGMGMISLHARQHLDTLIGAIWAIGMAIGILFISLTPGYAPDLFSFLFGNILLVPIGDLLVMTVLAVLIVVVVIACYQVFLAVTFDEEYAMVLNIPVEIIYLLLLSLVALTVVMLIRIVGIILVIALLTLPAAISREYSSRLRNMMVLSVVVGILVTTSGIFLSYFLDVPSGATIILIAAALYGLVLLERAFRKNNNRVSARNT
ncbi:MAG: metal ABC transporter permease [Methanomicrobiales archaeon]